MKTVVTLGELMLRLSPPNHKRFVQADTFEVHYGGGEANVATFLACNDIAARFVSCLPDNELGQAALNALRRYGVQVDFVRRGGDRLGVYYMERGASQRPSKVIYDRAASAFATSTSEQFDWQAIMRGADWFHFTGITPALGEGAAEMCFAACKAAKQNHCTVSCDLNYRSKLWSQSKAREVMGALSEYVDVCIANEEDAKNVFGIEAPGTELEQGVLDPEGYVTVAQRLQREFSFSTVAITMRQSMSASVNNWSGLLYDGSAVYTSGPYSVQIVDRVGAGDSFGAGLIYAILNSFAPQDIINFATAAGCLKHSIEGDFNLLLASEVQLLASGNGTGRVQR